MDSGTDVAPMNGRVSSPESKRKSHTSLTDSQLSINRMGIVPPTQADIIAQKNRMRRKHIAEEIVETERNYVDQLGAVVQLFKRPLENAHTSHVPQIDTKECELLFSAIEEIFRVNLSLLSKLNAKFKAWSDTQTIGDEFLLWAPEIAPYTEYINNYGTSIRTLNGLCRRREDFATFIQGRTYLRLTLKDLMIVPVQRIPRYTLLIQELLKHTDKKHPDFNNLTEAHELTKTLAMKCNEAKRDMDAVTRVDELSDRLVGYDKLVQDGRRYLTDSKVLQLCEGIGIRKYKKRDLYVFNDILMCVATDSDEADASLEFKWLLPLHNSTVSLLSEHADIQVITDNAVAFDTDEQNRALSRNHSTKLSAYTTTSTTTDTSDKQPAHDKATTHTAKHTPHTTKATQHSTQATDEPPARSSTISDNTTNATKAYSVLGIKRVGSEDKHDTTAGSSGNHGNEDDGKDRFGSGIGSVPGHLTTDEHFPLRKRGSIPFSKVPSLPNRPTMPSLGLNSDKANELRSPLMRRKSSIRSHFVIGLEHLVTPDPKDTSSATSMGRKSVDSSTSIGSIRTEAHSPSQLSRGSVQSRTSHGNTARDDEKWCGVRFHHDAHGTHDVYFEESLEKERVTCLIVGAIASCTAKRDNVAAQAAQDIKRKMTNKYCGGDVSGARDMLNERNRNRRELREQELQSYTESTRVKADELKSTFSNTYDLEDIMTKAAAQSSDLTSVAVPAPLPERRDRFANYGGLSAAQNFRLQAAKRQEMKAEAKSGSKAEPILSKVKQLAGFEASGKD